MRALVRAAAAAAALLALVGLVGSGVFLAMREDDPPPTTTTASTTTTTVPIAEVAGAIAAALRTDLAVPLTPREALCVANELLAVLAPADLEAITSLTAPLVSLDAAQRDVLVRGIVGCLPSATAAALLGSATTTTATPVELPDEGG